jgi:hypothetical protein
MAGATHQQWSIWRVDFNDSAGFHQLFVSYFILHTGQIKILASDF